MKDVGAYWRERAEKQGPAYVGPGGDTAKAMVQAAELGLLLMQVLGPVGPFASTLDFGCGPGRLASVLGAFTQRGHYWGVDVVHSSVRMAKHLHPALHFKAVGPRGQGMPGGRYALVASVMAFQHVLAEDWGPLASLLHKYMAPASYVLSIDAAQGSGEGAPAQPHVVRRRPSDLCAAFPGFRVLHQRDYLGHNVLLLGSAETEEGGR